MKKNKLEQNKSVRYQGRSELTFEPSKYWSSLQNSTLIPHKMGVYTYIDVIFFLYSSTTKEVDIIDSAMPRPSAQQRCVSTCPLSPTANHKRPLWMPSSRIGPPEWQLHSDWVNGTPLTTPAFTFRGVSWRHPLASGDVNNPVLMNLVIL